MADLGATGDGFRGISSAQYKYSIAGTVTDVAGDPARRYVQILVPASGTTTPPTIEMTRMSAIDGSFLFPLNTNTQRTVLCTDTADPLVNDLVFGKVIPG